MAVMRCDVTIEIEEILHHELMVDESYAIYGARMLLEKRLDYNCFSLYNIGSTKRVLGRKRFELPALYCLHIPLSKIHLASALIVS